VQSSSAASSASVSASAASQSSQSASSASVTLFTNTSSVTSALDQSQTGSVTDFLSSNSTASFTTFTTEINGQLTTARAILLVSPRTTYTRPTGYLSSSNLPGNRRLGGPHSTTHGGHSRCDCRGCRPHSPTPRRTLRLQTAQIPETRILRGHRPRAARGARRRRRGAVGRRGL
jgi:hypothetical protein